MTRLLVLLAMTVPFAHSTRGNDAGRDAKPVRIWRRHEQTAAKARRVFVEFEHELPGN